MAVVVLSGGVGGARAARALNGVVDDLTVVTNVGDDDEIHGVHVSADLDTVLYTLAGVQGPHGWGIAGDTFTVMDRLERLGHDTRFRLGDLDLATCLRRTIALRAGVPLAEITESLAAESPQVEGSEMLREQSFARSRVKMPCRAFTRFPPPTNRRTKRRFLTQE